MINIYVLIPTGHRIAPMFIVLLKIKMYVEHIYLNIFYKYLLYLQVVNKMLLITNPNNYYMI